MSIFITYLDDVFLSHLSGDEEGTDGYTQCLYFLSHLSGDEADTYVSSVLIGFLSHLSGDEEFDTIRPRRY